MEYLLFAGYLILFAWLITKVKFFTQSGLSNSQLIIIFLLKVMAGIFYGWVGIYYANMAQMMDTWVYHYKGIEEYKLLFHNPGEYFINLFRDPYNGGIMKFFEGKNSYWNDLKGNFFIKILSLFDILSFGNYYINVIFYSFISLFGPVGIYRIMNDVFPGKRIQVLAGIFLVPSFLYWTSGLHKEGLLFLGFILAIYNVYFGIKRKKFPVKSILLILLGLLIVLALRNYLIPILVAAMLMWLITVKINKKPIVVFTVGYAVFMLFFFTARYISNELDFPEAVVVKQKEFIALLGNSSVPIEKLEPKFSSFVTNFPQAVSLSILRPYPSDVRHILSLAAAAEINFLLFLFIIFLFLRKRNENTSGVFICFCLFFAFTLLLSVGYTVNNLGAIVRYRSIVFPFLMVPLLCSINWERLFNLFSSNIRNNNNVLKK